MNKQTVLFPVQVPTAHPLTHVSVLLEELAQTFEHEHAYDDTTAEQCNLCLHAAKHLHLARMNIDQLIRTQVRQELQTSLRFS